MAEGLAVRDVQSIRTELYDASSKRESLTLFGTCSFAPNTKVLVVDDIADSGETLEFIMNYLLKEYPDVSFVSATLFYKTTSVFEPDFWVQDADDWIDFFWERDFKS
jgi:xanthine phosphoribosyltransferase